MNRKVSGILNRYAKLPAGRVPRSVNVDFKTIIVAFGTDEMGASVSAAFRSNATPSVAEIVSEWYKKAPRKDRAAFLRRLDTMLRDAGLDWLLTPTDEFPGLDVKVTTAENLGQFVRVVESHASDVSDRIADQYAQAPKLMVHLDRKTRSAILRSAAVEREGLEGTGLESIENGGFESMAPPGAEEITSPPPPSSGGTTAPSPSGTAGGTDEPGPPPRYGSVELFEENGEWKKGKAFGGDQTFKEKQACLAEVAIRLAPKGVKPVGERRKVREPKQSKDVDVFVTVETKDFDVSPRVGKIVLPPKGDSTAQLFRLTPRRASKSEKDLLRVRFRFFYQLNLLQAITLRGGASAAIRFDDEEESAFAPAVPSLYYDVQSDANDFDVMQARALHIEVAPDNQQFQMTFTLQSEKGDGPAVPATAWFNTGQLASEIAGVRKTLFQVSSSATLGKQVAGDEWEYQDHLKDLAERGRKLWSLLFERGEGQEMTTAGALLQQNPLPEGSHIQVSVDPHAATFAYAWNLLYDRVPAAEGDYSELGFWGMRYVIEQRQLLPTPSVVEPEADGLEIGAMYWKFAQTPAQQTYLTGLLQQAGKARLSMGKLIDDAKTAMACIQSCKSHILYFFTHGYTGLPDGEQFGVTVKDFLDLYNKLPDNDETKLAWKNLAEDLTEKQYKSDESWIELSAGRLLLQELYNKIQYLPLRPFVILNMCDSAQVTPALSQSFIDLFLTRGARAVVGTECSIRPVFADYVGRELLKSMLSAVPIGEALRRVRRAAALEKNLLGLAYTQFGFADAVLEPALLPAAKTDG